MSDYLVPPTSADYNNATLYAMNRMNKKLCQARPDIYTWVEDELVPYPCPLGLTCSSGKCYYNETGCRAASQLDYFPCNTKLVPCEVPTRPGGMCEVCDYPISNGNFTLPAIKSEPGITPPATCAPGDTRYAMMTTDKDDDGNPIDTSKLYCKGMTYDPEPYLLNGQPVTCTNDMECALNGAGGACMLIPDRKATGKCVDTGMGYLEWRRNFTQWQGTQPQDACIATNSLFRRWCEMPWTRPPMDENKEEPMDVSMSDRVKLFPQVKKHPPFYYDDCSGKCYVTNPYCSNEVEDGGFETSFGVGKEYAGGMFSSCSYPEGSRKHIQEGYDCCTPLGQSVGEFFLGRTMLTY